MASGGTRPSGRGWMSASQVRQVDECGNAKGNGTPGL